MSLVKAQKIARPASKGQAVIESVASIIIFTLMMTLIVSFVLYLYFQQALVTAAREGARQAAISTSVDSGTVSAYVDETLQQLTGQSLAAGSGSVDVDGPTPSAADPNIQVVTVNVTYNLQNPIPIAEFAGAFGADASAFDVFEMNARASMRYET